jgi:hypothetical protein
LKLGSRERLLEETSTTTSTTTTTISTTTVKEEKEEPKEVAIKMEAEPGRGGFSAISQ